MIWIFRTCLTYSEKSPLIHNHLAHWLTEYPIQVASRSTVLVIRVPADSQLLLPLSSLPSFGSASVSLVPSLPPHPLTTTSEQSSSIGG